MKGVAAIIVGAGLSHIVGSFVFSVAIGGAMGILAAPLLALFGWFFIVPEAIAVSIQWMLYHPAGKGRIIAFVTISCVTAAAVVALIGPKEAGKEARWRIGYALAGFCSAAVSAGVVHGVKRLPQGP